MNILTDPNLKTARAKEHLDALKREWTIFVQSEPCRFSEKDDIQAGEYQIKIEVDDVPERLSLIAGDIFSCLRASLDQLVWSLATYTIGSYAEGTQFPIFSYWDTKTAAKFNGYTHGLPNEAIAIIDSLQPYHRGNPIDIHADLLWRLSKLCNIDKHRRIPAHGSTVNFKLSSSIPKNAVTIDDSGIMRFPLSMKNEVKLYPCAILDIVFGDSREGIECDLTGVGNIYEFVANDVIPRFARFIK